MTTNVFVRDLDLRLPDAADGSSKSRSTGCLCSGVPQLAVDTTTIVNAFHADGTAIRGCIERGWSGIGCREALERANLLRIGGTACPSKTGGAWCGGGWQVVHRDPVFPVPTRHSEGQWRGSFDAQKGCASLATEVGITFVVHSSACGGKFDVGASGSSGSWRSHSGVA